MKRTLFGTVAAGIMIFGTLAAPLPPAAKAQSFTLNKPSQTITFSPLQLQNETSAQQAKTAATSQIDSYYQSANGKSGPALKKALHDIIDDHKQLSYSQVWDALKKTDEDPKNPSNVLLLYSGVSRSKQANGGNVGQWNREHVWAKSHGNFGTSQGPGTDLHHLRATDVQTNSTRGNLDFDLGGNEYKGAPGNFYDSDSFEPHSRVKGDVARMLFYMAVRYEGDDRFPDLELNDKVNNGSAPLHGKMSVLLKWHKQDPVDQIERNRNEIIYETYQNNRNPFIDHPDWAGAIWE
ncbi:endonuclease I family protein [Bacillus pumilus]|jgi:endonuclease I|uniref:endonuclease I family protein n=1 Tax=Bacillus pumilus TaxID=1408 RepID=UPI00081FDE88|nr:endonuclease [Bacillus pumilus]AOC55540.1 ribonuclease [Bacillus pumilus]MBR0587249.1 ribonuclease [Bacillus pumilus DW2J2]MBR0617466.1 ribonuclease [Bacillus pumilus]MBR0624994.1 ribonuclease [Bacillus pumilus]MCY7723763.1 endonuclease [Bacillus pumilus]